MATYDELAKQYATNARTEYENSLGYLTDNLSNQQQLDESALKSKYDALLETINRQTTPIEEQYAADAQAAYINKMLAGQALNTNLSQLGVDTQGFGVNQRLGNETAYGQNLASLQKVRSEGLRDVANQATDAMNNYNTAAQQLAADYAGQRTDLAKYIQQMADNYYNTQYSNYLADLQYQDKLKQQEFENALRQQQLEEERRQADMANNQFYASLSADSGSGQFGWAVGTTYQKNNNGTYTYRNPNGVAVTVQSGVNPYTNTVNPDAANGKVFANGYQPNNIGGTPVKTYEKANAAKGKGVNVNGNWQNVWSANGKYYVWDGASNQYKEVFKSSGIWYVK